MNMIAFKVLHLVFVNASIETRDRTAEKIRSFAFRPAGWHYGSGGPATNRTVGRALGYLMLFRANGFLETDAFPGIDGEVMITGYRNGSYIELTLELDGSLRFAYQLRGEEERYFEDKRDWEVVELIDRVGSAIEADRCGISEWSTSITTITEEVGSRIWLSGRTETQITGQWFPYSKSSVLLHPADQYAPTYTNSIVQLPPAHRYTGPSTNPPYHPTYSMFRSPSTATTVTTT